MSDVTVLNSLADETIIVTGAASGIGLAVMLALVGEGARVVAADADSEALQRAVDSTATPRPRHVPMLVRCDVTLEEEVAKLADQAIEAGRGRIDALIACAGILRPRGTLPKPLVDVTLAEWEAVLNTNLRGVFLCNRAVLGVMITNRRGQIVNLSSTSGRQGRALDSAYCASKFGVIGLTEALAEEVKTYGVRVHLVLPDAVATPMWDQNGPIAAPADALPPSRVAAFIVYLLRLPEDTVLVNPIIAPFKSRRRIRSRTPEGAAVTGAKPWMPAAVVARLRTQVEVIEADGHWCPMAHCNRLDDSFQVVEPLRQAASVRRLDDSRVSPVGFIHLGSFTGTRFAVRTHASPRMAALAVYDYQKGATRWVSPIDDLPGWPRRIHSGLLIARMRLQGQPPRRIVFAANPAEFIAYGADGMRLWKRQSQNLTPAAPDGVGIPISLSSTDSREIVAATSEGWVIKLDPVTGRTIDAYHKANSVAIDGRVHAGTLITMKSPVVVGDVMYLLAEFKPDMPARFARSVWPVYVARINLNPACAAGNTASGRSPCAVRPRSTGGGSRVCGRPARTRLAARDGDVGWARPDLCACAQHRKWTDVARHGGRRGPEWRAAARVAVHTEYDARGQRPLRPRAARRQPYAVRRDVLRVFLCGGVDSLEGDVPSPEPLALPDMVGVARAPRVAGVSMRSPLAITFDRDRDEIVAYTNFKLTTGAGRVPYGYLAAFAAPARKRPAPRPLWSVPLGLSPQGVQVPGPRTVGQLALFRYEGDHGEATGIIVNTVYRGTYIIKWPGTSRVGHDQMRVLLTGGTGFIGRHMLARLLHDRHDVHLLALPETLGDLPRHPRLHRFVGNLADRSVRQRAARSVDIVVHLAATVAGLATREFRTASVEGTRNLLDASVEAGVTRFIYLSSTAVYGLAPFPIMWPILEDSPLAAHGSRGLRLYGWSKIEGEKAVRRAQDVHGLDNVILRPTVVHGSGAIRAQQLLTLLFRFPSMMSLEAAPNGVIQWLNVRDLVEMTILAMTEPACVNEALNAAGEAVSMADVSAALNVAGSPWRMRSRRLRPLGQLVPPFSTEKAKGLLGWVPTVGIREGLREMLSSRTTSH